MSQQNPFRIIRPTDQPPESLRKEVMSSVKLLMLVMRFAQLFLGDYANSLFDKVRHLGAGDSTRRDRGSPDLTDPNTPSQ